MPLNNKKEDKTVLIFKKSWNIDILNMNAAEKKIIKKAHTGYTSLLNRDVIYENNEISLFPAQ